MAALFALLSSLSWGSADFIGGLTSKKLPSILVVALSQIAGLVLIGIIVVATGAWSAPLDYLGWAVIAAVCGASGLIVFYRALATGTMGVVAPISAMAGIVPLLAGLLAGERFTLIAAIGAAVIGLGVILASGPELSDRAGKPVLLAVVAAVLFGFTLLAIARGSEVSPVMTMAAMRVVQVGVLVPIVLVGIGTGRMASHGVRKVLPLIILSGVLDVVANLAFGYSAKAGPLVVVAVLGSLYPVVTAVLAATVLHERLRGIQYAGVAFAISGLILMSLG